MFLVRTLLLAVVLACGWSAVWAQTISDLRPLSVFSGLFIENNGQWDRRAAFLLRSGGLDAWITDDGFVYDVYREVASDSTMPRRIGQSVRVRFDGASTGRVARSLGQRAGRFNYFIGADPTRWASGAGIYERVRIDSLYDGVDALFSVEEGRLRYDLLLAAGVEPATVRLRIEGADSVSVTEQKILTIATGIGRLEQRGLYAYQEIAGERLPVSCGFDVHADGTVGFTVGAYDRSYPLVIDPLTYSTFIGGTGEDVLTGIAVGRDSTAYVTGHTVAADFPTVVGAYDRAANGDKDVVAARLSADGSGLIHATFIGGADEDRGQGVRVDGEGNAYVVGYTRSHDFPTTPGAFETEDTVIVCAFVLKLAPDGSALRYSTFLGGYANSYNLAFAVALDESGAAYVTGRTTATNFPTTEGAYARDHRGSYDLFVSKLNPEGSDLIFSTLIGGSVWEEAEAIAVDKSGEVYLAGYTSSTDYPVTGGSYDESHNGKNDVFLTKLSADGSRLRYSTLLGGAENEVANGVAVDESGSAYVAGSTASPEFPTIGDVADETHNGGDDVFVTKFGVQGEKIEYSTFLGGGGGDIGFGLGVDRLGQAYVAGRTNSTDFPVTPDAVDGSPNGEYDAFVTKLDSKGESAVYSTLIGSAGADAAYAVALDGRGNAYAAGITEATDFPTTPGAYDRVAEGDRTGFILKLPLANPDDATGVDAVIGSAKEGVAILSAPSLARDELVVRFVLSRATSVAIELFNSAGERIDRPTAHRLLEAGTHESRIVAGGLPQGVYVLRIVAGPSYDSRPVIIVW